MLGYMRKIKLELKHREAFFSWILYLLGEGVEVLKLV